jgi:hypothetical protein
MLRLKYKLNTIAESVGSAIVFYGKIDTYFLQLFGSFTSENIY